MICQSGSWNAQRPTRVVEAFSEGLSCAGDAQVTSAAGVYSVIAACPTGTTLVGGGYLLANGAARSPYKPPAATGTNSPDRSSPSGTGGWLVAAGGYPDFCFHAVALCAE